MLGSPIVLNRIIRARGFDFLIDNVLSKAKLALQFQCTRRSAAPHLGADLKMLTEILRVCENQRNFMRKGPSMTFGFVLQNAFKAQLEDQVEIQTREEGDERVSAAHAIIHKMQQSLVSLVEEANDLTERAGAGKPEREGEMDTLCCVDEIQEMMLRVEGALEAGLFEVFSKDKRSQMEADLKTAVAKIHNWLKKEGNALLTRLLREQLVENERKNEDGNKTDVASTVSVEMSLHGDVEATPHTSDSKVPTAVETPGDYVKRRMSKEILQRDIAQIATLMSLGCDSEGPTGGSQRALIRLELTLDINDPSSWGDHTSQSFYRSQDPEKNDAQLKLYKDAESPAIQSPDLLHITSVKEKVYKSEALLALRAELLSQIYASGMVNGLIVRLLILENVPIMVLVDDCDLCPLFHG